MLFVNNDKLTTKKSRQGKSLTAFKIINLIISNIY